jgi:hypothetical protein
VHNSEYAPDRSPSFDQKFVSFDWAVVVPQGVPFALFVSFLEGGIECGGGNVYNGLTDLTCQER